MNAFFHSLTHSFTKQVVTTYNVSGSVLCAGDTEGTVSAIRVSSVLERQIPKKLITVKCGDSHDRIIRLGCTGERSIFKNQTTSKDF